MSYCSSPEILFPLFRLWETKKCMPVVYPEVFQGLEGVPQGLIAIENRETWGKAVVRIREENPSAKL